jgi:hypothetical protein
MGDKLADLVLEFLEAAVHETLYVGAPHLPGHLSRFAALSLTLALYSAGSRGKCTPQVRSLPQPHVLCKRHDLTGALLPHAESFERAVLYNVPVHMNQHPLLCEYVHSVLGGCRAWLASAELDKLSLVALSETGRVVRTLVMEPQIIECSVTDDTAAGEQEPALPLRQLEEVFRTALVALVAAPLTVDNGEKTGDKPASFRILAHTVEDSARPDTTINGADASNSWILADQLWRGELAQQRSVFPVKTAQSADCPVRINLFMQTTERSDNGTRS